MRKSMEKHLSMVHFPANHVSLPEDKSLSIAMMLRIAMVVYQRLHSIWLRLSSTSLPATLRTVVEAPRTAPRKAGAGAGGPGGPGPAVRWVFWSNLLMGKSIGNVRKPQILPGVWDIWDMFVGFVVRIPSNPSIGWQIPRMTWWNGLM